MSKHELVKYDIKDKNDRPVIASAAHESAFLVTEDSVLMEDAKKYIESMTPGNALKKLS
jgi:PIN domain nuclease of toxin-antitoxin system